MSYKASVVLADGYRCVSRKETVDLSRAGEILRASPGAYTFARLTDGQAELTSHRIVCPACGCETLPYARRGRKLTEHEKELLAMWEDAQYSLPGFVETELTLNRLSVPKSSFRCPACGRTSAPGLRGRRLDVTAGKNRIVVSLDKALPPPVLPPGMEIPEGISFTEIVVFNLARGRVIRQTVDSAGCVLRPRDVTNARRGWEGSCIYTLIDGNRAVREKVAEAFQSLYPVPLPCAVPEMTPETFAALTQFVGYPGSFYDAVPYDMESERIDRSFRAAARKLRRAEALPGLLERSGLPGLKSVKRLFFSTPGLFFYLDEAVLMWEVLADPNRLCRILSDPNAFELLSFLHCYPGCADFFRDYRKTFSAGKLCELLHSNWDAAAEYGLHYSMMRPGDRPAERKRWKNPRFTEPFQVRFSTPMPRGSQSIRDCTVEGFRFSWLGNRAAYAAAASALSNCLRSWSPANNPVVAVRRNGEYVAAIEVAGNTVVQARLRENDSIESDRELWQAYRLWMEKFSLKEDEYSFFALPVGGLPDDDDDMPF